QDHLDTANAALSTDQDALESLNTAAEDAATYASNVQDAAAAINTAQDHLDTANAALGADRDALESLNTAAEDAATHASDVQDAANAVIDALGDLEAAQSTLDSLLDTTNTNQAPSDLQSDIAGSNATTGQIQVGTYVTGQIGAGGADHDWYRIDLVAGQQYVFQLDGVDIAGTSMERTPDAYLYLRDANGNYVTHNDDSGGNMNSIIFHTPSVTGAYYLDAGSYANARPGEYQLTARTIDQYNNNVAAVPAAQDAAAVAQAAADAAQATADAAQDAADAAQATADAARAALEDDDREDDDREDDDREDDDREDDDREDDDREDDDRDHDNNGHGNGDQDAPGNSGSHNNAENATYSDLQADMAGNTSTRGLMQVGSYVTGQIGAGGADHDWYHIDLVAGQRYVFQLDGVDIAGTSMGRTPDAYLYLRDANGNYVTHNDDSGGNMNSIIFHTPSVTGAYYLDATSWAERNAGEYRLTARTESQYNNGVAAIPAAQDAAAWVAALEAAAAQAQAAADTAQAAADAAQAAADAVQAASGPTAQEIADAQAAVAAAEDALDIANAELAALIGDDVETDYTQAEAEAAVAAAEEAAAVALDAVDETTGLNATELQARIDGADTAAVGTATAELSAANAELVALIGDAAGTTYTQAEAEAAVAAAEEAAAAALDAVDETTGLNATELQARIDGADTAAVGTATAELSAANAALAALIGDMAGTTYTQTEAEAAVAAAEEAAAVALDAVDETTGLNATELQARIDGADTAAVGDATTELSDASAVLATLIGDKVGSTYTQADADAAVATAEQTLTDTNADLEAANVEYAAADAVADEANALEESTAAAADQAAVDAEEAMAAVVSAAESAAQETGEAQVAIEYATDAVEIAFAAEQDVAVAAQSVVEAVNALSGLNISDLVMDDAYDPLQNLGSGAGAGDGGTEPVVTETVPPDQHLEPADLSEQVAMLQNMLQQNNDGSIA
ncbi:MAG: pre-peptidase C-terminal domain-containing protein, partial [Gallionella sp.]